MEKRNTRDIPLTVEQYEELARAMQFPEHLEAWDRANTPLRVTLDGDILTVVDRFILTRPKQSDIV